MEHILDTEKMDAMKALADTNIKVSEAKEALMKLKSLETTYLSGREKETKELVDKVVKDSEALLREAKGNYEEVKQLYNTVSEFVTFLTETYEKLEGFLEKVSEHDRVYRTDLKAKGESINQLLQEIRNDKIRIKNDQESLNRKSILLRDAQRKLDLDRATLDRAINRLKEGKI